MGFVIQDFLAIPTKPGVYLFYGPKDEILYIGKAKNLKNRIKQYFAPGSVWKQDMLDKAIKLDFMLVNTESEALYLEDNLIKKHKPIYNSLLKADNSYVYIKITKGPFPLIFVTRMRKNDGSIYLGPKHYTRDLAKLLHYLRQVFHYRTCSTSVFLQGKVCSDYHFGMCEGRCVYEKRYKNNTAKKSGSLPKTTHQSNTLKKNQDKNAIGNIIQSQITPIANIVFQPQYTYEQAVAKNKKMVHLLVDFFSGKTKSIQDQLVKEIESAIQEQRFEYAAVLRDILHGITFVTEKQHVVLDTTITGKIMKVRTMEGRYVLSVANIFEGKIIDVLRFKYRTSDTQIDDLIRDFISEYGESIIVQPDGTHITTTVGFGQIKKNTLCMTTSMKKITKKTLHEVEILLDNFIDGYVASSTFQKENIMSDLLQGLQTRYELPVFPYSIECTDISHLSGGWTSGAVVSMKEGLLNKKSYRRYKIGQGSTKNSSKGITASDDYTALREVITRRFKGIDLSGSYIPDVFVLDGGKGQLDIIKQLYQEEERFRSVYERVHFCSLGKGAARKRAGKILGEKECLYWFDANTIPNTWKILQRELQYDDVDRLLLTLRDEAHRFSNKYRKKQMSMEFK